jgi:hypothetical protein
LLSHRNSSHPKKWHNEGHKIVLLIQIWKQWTTEELSTRSSVIIDEKQKVNLSTSIEGPEKEEKSLRKLPKA